MKTLNKSTTSDCGYKCGSLPECSPLALAVMPVQDEHSPYYEKDDALNRGTLFPGLDLPFKNIINKSNPYAGTPLGEVMALDFVIKELNLYLDIRPRAHSGTFVGRMYAHPHALEEASLFGK